MLRKLFCVLCALCILLGLIGCGSPSAESSAPVTDTSTSTTAEASTTERSVTTTVITSGTITSTTARKNTTTVTTTTTVGSTTKSPPPQTTSTTATTTTTSTVWEEPVEEELRIAIAGNSYVGYSNIVFELLKLIGTNGKNATAESYRHDGYTTGAFLYETEFMEAIRSGQHDILFMCGLFSSYDVQAMTVIEEACRESGTQLVLFPAYNEDPNAIAEARQRCPSAKLVHWKDLTGHLINEGILPEYLMLYDAYLHPRPLAGYAGAVMIYTALYGDELADVEADPFEPDLNRLELSDSETDAVYQQVHRLAVEYTSAHVQRIIEED